MKPPRTRLLQSNRMLADIFSHFLNSKKYNTRVYLERRGVNASLWSKFKLGYFPSKAEVEEVIRREFHFLPTYQYVQTRMEHSITFPISDYEGEIVGFSYRLLHDNAVCKYINTKENTLFHKGDNLYNIHGAKKFILEQDVGIVCEGQFDVITLWEYGFKNAVCCLGTSFTPTQARLLKRFCNNAILIFDADKAGKEAKKRTSAILGGMNVRTISLELPDKYKDIDEYLRAGFLENFEATYKRASDRLNVKDYCFRLLT